MIHRDLKSANVLVTSSDGKPVPKIIDFGIAKAAGLEGIELTSGFTHSGQALGTPAYMSPEQAGMGRIDIDTRTDVYSLGVMLYESLTGCLPVDAAEMGYVHFLSLLSNGELRPPRPSSRGNFRRQLQGDLDCIVMKAMEVDRTRRYDTAAALADDLLRFLQDEPILARPAAIRYRVGKFVCRFRVQVAAACVASVALLAGAGAAGVALMHATGAEITAKQEAATAREVSDFLVQIFKLSNPNGGPGKATMRELLDRSVGATETQLRGQPRVQSKLFGTFSHVYEALGLYRESKTMAEKSLRLPHIQGREGELQRATELLDLGRSNMRLGLKDEAERYMQNALTLRTSVLGENHLDVARVLINLGGIHTQQSRLDQAVSDYNRALAIQRRITPDDTESYASLRGLGMLHLRKEDSRSALEWLRSAHKVVEKKYGGDHPFMADSLHNLALALEKSSRLAEAQGLLERSLAIRKRVLPADHPDLAFDYHALGRVMVAQGNFTRALPYFEEGLRVRRVALGSHHPRTAELAASLTNLQVRLKRP